MWPAHGIKCLLRSALLGVMLSTLGSCGSVDTVSPPSPPIQVTPEPFPDGEEWRRVQEVVRVGMTQDEVSAALGREPTKAETGEGWVLMVPLRGIDGVFAAIMLDASGKVVSLERW